MERNSLVSFENLCKIFEMRIKLDKDNGVKTSLEVLDNYEKYSKKIDSIYNSEFQKELKPLISPAVTLEKEKDRLRRLIKLLEDRLDRRVELEDRYYDITGKYLSGLQMIVSEDELEEKRERLSLISSYLETSEEINNVTESIAKLRDLLEEEEKKKEEYESKNKIMEDELYSSFVSAIKNDDYYRELNEDEIVSELDNIRSSVTETKETLDITKESIGSLVTSGLDDDYASYVEEAERNYYNYKNKELILKIYKLVMDFEEEFKLICSKREKINELLEEKKELGKNLVINVEDELLSFEKVLLVQCNTLDNEKEVLDNIVNYASRIKFKEERLDELNELNDSADVLSILREYGLIETYDTNDVVLEEIEDEVVSDSFGLEIPSLEDIPAIEEDVVEEFYDPYRIIEITDYPKTLNVGLAKLKGESVREKVNKKLNPKKEEEATFVDMINEEVKVESEPVSDEVDVKVDIPSVDTILPELTVELEKKEEIASDGEVKVEMPVVEGMDNDVKIEIPVVEEPKAQTPVWELPTQLEPKSITFDEQQDVSSLPVWDVVEPQLNSIPVLDGDKELENFNIVDKPVDTSNAFWKPVSENKVETNVFPSIGMPVNKNASNNSEFVFPTINN